MPYRLLGIDLDGTLLNSRGEVPPANLDAIRAAQEGGMLVVPCTGRAWRESRLILEQLPTLDRGVFVTGACICQTDTGESLNIATIEPHLAHEVVQFLRPLPESVLVFRDANLCGHDYLVTGDGEPTVNTRWWFDVTGATVHTQHQVGPEDLHHTLRVGMVAPTPRIAPLTEKLRTAFGDSVLVQSFAAVQTPDPTQSVHILEVFAAGVDKWRGMRWIARQHGIEAAQIAVIGDEINDVGMLSSAGCGIAMANGIDAARAAADHVTLSNDQGGVAHAIGRLLAGAW